MVRKRAELGVYVACALACVLGVAITASVACGSTTDDTSIDRDAGLPAVIETPPLACTATDGGCACEPSDAGVLDASASLCGTGVAPDAACCAGPDYPFAGACACGAAACPACGGRCGELRPRAVLWLVVRRGVLLHELMPERRVSVDVQLTAGAQPPGMGVRAQRMPIVSRRTVEVLIERCQESNGWALS